MSYEYLVFPNYNEGNFLSACAMMEALLPELKKNDYLSGVDGPIQNYSFGNQLLTVYGKIKDDEVSVSSGFPISYLQKRSVTI